MARALTPTEEAYLRSEKQFSLLYLAFGSPATVFTARVNGVPSSNDRVAEIDYDGGSPGYGSALADQTVLIGSTPGAYDRGIARLRGTLSGASGTMKIGEESEIEWTDNDYLTVLDEFALWPRHLRITSGGVVYVDYEIAYSNQHSACDPVPVLGPPPVKRLTGSTVDVDFDASDSWVPGSAISAYAWSAPGASATSGMSTATPTITYNATGRHRVSCTLTAANGATFTGYRYARIFDSDPPMTNFRLDDCAGDWGRGEWSFRVTMFDEARLSEVRDRAQVILFARDWYGGTEVSIGPVDDRENVVAVGWIAGESIKWNPEQGSVSFTVQGPQFWMDKMMGFPAGIENCSSTPAAWTEYKDLTLDAGLWHFLHWRTTATRCMDVSLTGDTRKISVFDSPAASLWQQISQESERAILAHPACDRYGRLFVQVDSNLMPESDRGAIPIVQALTTQDWRDQIDIERHVVDEVALMDTSGVAYTGGSSATPLFSLSPGHVFRRYGAVQRRERLALANQTDANELCGLLAGKANNEYPNVDIRLAANHRALDICPHQYITLTVAETDTERGISFTDKKFVPRRVSLRHNPDTGTLTTDITVEGYTTAELAVTGDPPPSPPAPPDPELPPDPTPAPTPGLWEGDVKAAVAWNGSQIGYTSDLLRHQVVSTATTGTSGTTLYDTSLDDHPGEDFNDVGVEVGDIVENLEVGSHSHEWTTVTAVVSGSQLTLAADIGLAAGDAYHISGTEWHDISGSIVLDDDEDILDFVYIRTGDSDVGAWLLTDQAVRYTTNIITTSPVWVTKLTLSQMQALLGSGATFKCIAVDSGVPTYAIVAATVDRSNADYGADYSVEAAVETSDTGSNWAEVLYDRCSEGANVYWSPIGTYNHAIVIERGVQYALRYASGTTIPTVRPYTACWVDAAIQTASDDDAVCGGGSYSNGNVGGMHVANGIIYVYCSDGGTFFSRKSDDGGATFNSIDPPGYSGTGYETTISGAYSDEGDVLALWIDGSTSDEVLMRSTDGGVTWSEIGNANDLFDYIPTLYGSTRSIAPYVWEPDSAVLLWCGRAVDDGSKTRRRLFYSDDGGATWLFVMGDWYDVFGSWIGNNNGGLEGFAPLPRVGANE